MPAAAYPAALSSSAMPLVITGHLRWALFLVVGLAVTIVWFLALYMGLRFAQWLLPRRREKNTDADSVPAVGLLAALFLATLVFATMSRQGVPWPVDTSLHRWSVLHRPDGAADAAIVVTTTATGVFAYPLAALAGWLGAPQPRRWWGSLGAVGALALVQLVRFGLAVAIGRARPPSADWAWHASGSAMPSGHTTTSAFVAILIVYGAGRRWPLHRGIAAAAAIVWAVAVGASRVYLGVHWPTDVVAGWLLVAVIAASMSIALKTAARRSASTHLDRARADAV